LKKGPTDLEQLCPSSLQGQASNFIIGTICHVRHKKAVAKALLNG